LIYINLRAHCSADGYVVNGRKVWISTAQVTESETAVLTHGGFGYANEYHVERYFREAMLLRIAPISTQLIMCYIAEKVLGLPKSY
jgi:acyl-CoA dehydrogenase